MFWAAVLVSLKTASAAIVLTFFLGILAAGLVAGRRPGWKMFFDCVFTLPLVLPPTVVGFLLLLAFGVNRPLGRFFLEYFGYKIAFSWSAAVLAAVVISFPLMYRAARGALEQVEPNLIFAARTLGMPEWTIFRRVSLPAALPGLAAGGVLAFARGLGEFGATAMIAGNIAGRTRTLPMAVYSAAASGDMEAAQGYVAAIVVMSFAVIGLMNYLTRGRTRPADKGRK